MTAAAPHLAPGALVGAPTPVQATVALVVPPEEPPRDLQPTDVTPGVLGFSVIFGVALVVILITVAMTSSLRRVKHTRPDPTSREEQTPDEGRTG